MHYLSFLRTAAMISEARLQRPDPRFYSSKVLRVPNGHYVELNFTMWTSLKYPCLDDIYLEINDGHKKSANLLGVFCATRISSIVRSSGHEMLLKLSRRYWHSFIGTYSGKATNITGKYCVGEIKKSVSFQPLVQ